MQNENIIEIKDQNKSKAGTRWLLLSPLVFYGAIWVIFWGILSRLDFLRDDFGIILGLMNIFLYVLPTLIFTIIYEKRLASTSKNFFLFSLYQSAVFGFVSVFSVVLADLERPAQLLLFFLKFPLHIITSKESPILRTAVCLAVSLIVYFLIRKKTVNKNVGIALLYAAFVIFYLIQYLFPAILRTEFEDFFADAFFFCTVLIGPIFAIIFTRKESDTDKRFKLLFFSGLCAFVARFIADASIIAYIYLRNPNNPANAINIILAFLTPSIHICIYTVMIVAVHSFGVEINTFAGKLQKKKLTVIVIALLTVAAIYLIYPLIYPLISQAPVYPRLSVILEAVFMRMLYVLPIAYLVKLLLSKTKEATEPQQDQA